MEDFEIIGWPDIQEYMEYDDFHDNATLIDPNEKLGIDSSTYLVSKEWLEEVEERHKDIRCPLMSGKELEEILDTDLISPEELKSIKDNADADVKEWYSKHK